MFSLKKFRQWLDSDTDLQSETQWADEYTDPAVREEIVRSYRARYEPITTPYTDPMLYDPLNPPEGWRYDPHNEFWVRIKS